MAEKKKRRRLRNRCSGQCCLAFQLGELLEKEIKGD